MDANMKNILTAAALANVEEIDPDSDCREHGCARWRCDEDHADMVTVETMPDHLRGSHRAAGNWGTYPMNGAERSVVSRPEADAIVEADEDGYDHIVGAS